MVTFGTRNRKNGRVNIKRRNRVEKSGRKNDVKGLGERSDGREGEI